jgi:hypothetical protein
MYHATARRSEIAINMGETFWRVGIRSSVTQEELGSGSTGFSLWVLIAA